MIMNILGTRPIAFNPDLAHALGSIKAALFLSQLLYWWDKGDDPDWIYKTMNEIQRETALSRKEQDGAIKICKEYNLIQLERRQIPAKRHFRLNIENIVEFLKEYYSTLSERDKLLRNKSINKIVSNGQSNTYNTSI